MKRTVEALLRRWGRPVAATLPDGTVTVRAILVPTLSESWKSARRLFRDAGEVPTGQFLYLGPPEPTLCTADCLEADGRKFRISRAEPIYMGDEVLYRWAVAVPLGKEAATWES